MLLVLGAGKSLEAQRSRILAARGIGLGGSGEGMLQGTP